MTKLGGCGFKVSVAAGITAYIWIHNAAFNVPIWMWTDVRKEPSGRIDCYPRYNATFVFVARIINFYVPMIITWTSYIGIIYRMKRYLHKVVKSVAFGNSGGGRA